MRFSIFTPLILIVSSLGTMLAIIIRRFSQLSLLDVESLPEVKEEKKKNEFLKKRVEAVAVQAKKERVKRLQPYLEHLKEIQLSFRKYVGRVERTVWDKTHTRNKDAREKISDQPALGNERVRALLSAGALACAQGRTEEAEQKYLAVIRLDPKNKDAYRGLGDVYHKQGQTAEAKETYKFLHQLDPTDDQVIVKLGELAEEEGDLTGALEYYQQAALLNDNVSQRFGKLAELFFGLGQYPTALEAIEQAADLEPMNPKYLDLMTEISILVGDKERALNTYQRLRMVNPENHKLAALKDKIERLPG